MKKRFTRTISVGVALLGGIYLAHPVAGAKASASPKKKEAKSTLSSADKSFMTKAAKGGMMEVDWGKTASEKAQNSEVKKFGNRMVTEHSKANDELKAIAAKKGVTLPNSSSNPKWKSDKSYMDMMVKDHEKDLAEFQEAAKNGGDADVKKFAEKGAKMVQKHLEMAKDIDGKVK
jgi:putative membrane protein